jgi:hypothetical protein
VLPGRREGRGPDDRVGAVEQPIWPPRMFARCGGDASHALTTSRGVTWPHEPAKRFSPNVAYRYPAAFTPEVTASPHGVCENCPHAATRSPLSAAARWSAERRTSRERRSRARAQFTRQATARICTAAGAEASSAARHAPTGARYELDARSAPSARPARRNASVAASASAGTRRRDGAAAVAIVTARTVPDGGVRIRPLTG